LKSDMPAAFANRESLQDKQAKGGFQRICACRDLVSGASRSTKEAGKGLAMKVESIRCNHHPPLLARASGSLRFIVDKGSFQLDSTFVRKSSAVDSIRSMTYGQRLIRMQSDNNMKGSRKWLSTITRHFVISIHLEPQNL